MLILLGSASAARAQFFLLPSPYVAGGYGVGFSSRGRHTHVAAYLSGGTGYYTGSGFGYPYYAGSASRLTIVQVYNPPPLVIGVPAGGLGDVPARGRPRPAVEEVEPPDEKPLPGAVAGGFRPVRPEDRAEAQARATPQSAGAPKEKPKEPAPPEMPRPPRPEADPHAESARQVALGKDAFAAAEYGRAAQRFRQAVRVDPTDALRLVPAGAGRGRPGQVRSGRRGDPGRPGARTRLAAGEVPSRDPVRRERRRLAGAPASASRMP